MSKVDDLRIKSVLALDSPAQVIAEVSLTSESIATVLNSRNTVKSILHDGSNKLVVVVGPCSIHDVKSAMEYANKLLPLKEKYKNELEIIMRVYFEKPRTTIGWKGLINDPGLDETFNINLGLRMARELLQKINHIGLPTATEFLDLISPQYVAELISWGAIGARTTESQGHRELASGLSCPIGFKNGTNGNLQIAIDAIGSSKNEHNFISTTKEGKSAAFSTLGNNDCHIILRGGVAPNYDENSVKNVIEQLNSCGCQNKIMIDFSHANSNKDYRRQIDVCEDVSRQVSGGNTNIMGVMIESNLVAGKQSLVAGNSLQDLVYGQSITDGCISWEETESMLQKLSESVILRNAAKP